MLKKRLLSSVMASIMAVSAFSVVTSADATATTTEAPVEETKAVKTKAELKAYVDGFDAAYKSSVYKFGTYASNRWLKAYDVAEKTLNDSGATDEEISNAYYYLETATAKNIPHTFDEVSGLLKTHKAKYDRANILNESLRDLEYTADSYANFETAYSYALSVSATSTEEQLANAYVDLENAANGLSNTVIVTKTQFASLIKRLDAAKLIRDKYEGWRRASSIDFDRFNDGVASGITTKENNAPIVWEDLAGINENHMLAGSWISVSSFGVVNPKAQSTYIDFYELKEVSKTSDEEIVNAYKEALKTVSAMESFKADSFDRSSSSAVARELNDNYADILFKMAKPALVSGSAASTEEDSATLKAAKETYYAYTAGTAAEVFNADGTLTAAGKTVLKESTEWYAVKSGESTYTLTKLDAAAKATKATGATAEVAEKPWFTMTGTALTAEGITYLTAVTTGKFFKLAADVDNGSGETIEAGTIVTEDTLKACKTLATGEAIFDGDYTDEVKAALGITDKAKVDEAALSTEGLYEVIKDSADMGVKNGEYVVIKDDDKANYKTKAKEAVAGTPWFNDDGTLTDEGKKNCFPAYEVVVDIKYNTSTNVPAGRILSSKLDGTELAKYKTSGDASHVKLFDKDGNPNKDYLVLLENGKYEAQQAITVYTSTDGSSYTAKPDADLVAGAQTDFGGKTTTTGTTSTGGVLAQFTGLFDSEANLTAAGKKALTKLDTLKYRATADISGLNLVNRKDAKKVVTSISKGTIIDISDYVSFATASAAIADKEFKAAFDKTVSYVNTAEAKATVYPGVTDISQGPSNEYNVLVDKNTGSVEEWSVVYRFFKYELNDNNIPLTGKTIADLKKRVEESYACDKIESAHFVKWLENVTKERKEAIEVIKANDVDGATAAWNDLNGVINAFNDELARYKYSYGDIAAAIYDATKKVDSGEYVITDDYKNAINATSVALISLIPSTNGDEAFDAYSDLIFYNRLYTDSNGATAEEKALTSAMNKLVELTKALEAKPEFAAGDVNGDGAIDSNDALLILDYSVDPAKVEGKTFHVEAADVNGDGSVNSLDAIAALDIAVKA